MRGQGHWSWSPIQLCGTGLTAVDKEKLQFNADALMIRQLDEGREKGHGQCLIRFFGMADIVQITLLTL